jgi:hypothetical protein
MHGEMRNAYKISIRKPEEKRPPLIRPQRRWEDGIKVDLTEIGFESMDWMHLAQYTDRCGLL